MQNGMESCLGKSLISGVMGFALGGAFGLFMSSVRSPSSLPLSTLLESSPLDFLAIKS